MYNAFASKTIIAALALAVPAAGAFAAQKLVASQSIGDVFVDNPATTLVPVNFAGSSEPITGVGLTGGFTAVNADLADGLYPWSLDLAINVTSPDAKALNWAAPIGGDRTFVDYPYADFTGGLNNAQAGGTWNFEFRDVGPSPLASFRVEDAAVHLLTEVPDVVTPVAADVSSGPQWSRPFFIDGVSGLGPVFYEAISFTVSESGGYVFDSTVSNGNAFTFLYAGGFDPAQPLVNLLDYGLGNGSSPFGVPAGQSVVEALLFEGVEYTFVLSQWDRFTPGQTYTGSITGPGEVVIPEPAGLIGLAMAGLCAVARRKR